MAKTRKLRKEIDSDNFEFILYGLVILGILWITVSPSEEKRVTERRVKQEHVEIPMKWEEQTIEEWWKK